MKTLAAEMFDWCTAQFGWKQGVNAFLNILPDTNQVSGEAWWLIDTDSYVSQQMISKSKLKRYTLTLNYRHTKARVVDATILKIEQILNHTTCFQLPSYKVIQMQASNWNADQDVENENFYRGSLTITLDVLDTY